MRNPLRVTVCVIAFVACLQWPGRASANATITGIVGDIDLGTTGVGFAQDATVIWFKYTDATQTANCNGTYQGQLVGAATAWFAPGNSNAPTIADGLYREIYAALLISKKGATFTCIVDSTTNCHLITCTLP